MDPYEQTIGRTPSEQEILDSFIAHEVCEHCNANIAPGHEENVCGYSLCPDCAPEWKATVEEDLRERAIQMAMNNLPVDELMTLKWSLSCLYEGINDKSGCENIHQWNNRIEEALRGR